MKSKFLKRFLSLMLCTFLAIPNVVQVSADTASTDTVDQDDASDGAVRDVEVTYEKLGQFIVTIPKTIVLDDEYKSNYSVKVEGDIPSDQKVRVTPVDGITDTDGINFYMEDQSGVTLFKDDVVANVAHTKDDWSADEVLAATESTDNSVESEALTAGSWRGTFTFEINLMSIMNLDVSAKDADGNDLNASSTVIVGDERDNLLSQLETSGLVTSADDVDALIDVDSDSFDTLAEATFDVSDIAEEGDKVVILHYDEIKGEWEYIGEDTVDENGTVSGDFTSFSPVAFVKVTDEGTYEHIHNFDENDECSCGYEMPEISITYANNEQFGITPDITEYTVPETVQVDGVEYKVTALIYAFNGCPNLKSVELNDNIKKISGAFSYSGLESISIPSSVENAEEAFVGCTNLTSVTFEGEGSCNLGHHTFKDCTNLDNVVLPKGKWFGTEAFSGCTSLSNITLAEDTTIIPDNAFYGCTNLTSIDIPDSVTKIYTGAFSGTGLVELTIPDNVTYVGDSAFTSCKNLKYIKLPKYMENSTTCIFSGCSSLETVIMPESMSMRDPTINCAWFKDCTSLTNFVVPDYITYIAMEAFSGCTNLDLTIPDSVQQIDDGAFTNVKHITYNGTATGSPWGALSIN